MKRSLSLLFLLAAAPLWAVPFDTPPVGHTVVAEDDCGDVENMAHVVRGKEYVFAASMVAGPRAGRDIIFDNDFCLLQYKGLNPQAAYKVDVVYVTEAAGVRQQALEANGYLVHDTLPLPASTPGRFLFDIPRAAYADGKPLELKFLKKGGANAVVSYVRLWSTDPRRLPGATQLWQPSGPVEKDWARQDRLRGKPRFAEWEDPAKEISEQVVPCLDEVLSRGRKILADLEALGASDLRQAATALAAVGKTRDQLLAAGEQAPKAWLKAYLAARWAVRRLAFKNPLLKGDGLLFVRRHHPNAMHQCARRQGAFTLPGGGICVLRGIVPDGSAEVECLAEGKFPPGTFSRPDLSFDGKRLVFGFARQREAGEQSMDYGGISQETAPLYATHQTGPCHEFQVWEMALDGNSPPRQLTSGPSENSDPLYLPDGRIAFMSHRPGGLVQCGDWALAYCLFTMKPDGSDVRQLTVSKDGEWDPFLLNDGTLGFTRWEYVMKFWSPIQMLWSVRPDGTNPRMIYGSDLRKQYAYPLNYAAAQQIPGGSKLVCIGSAHHNTGAGPVCLVDLALGSNDADALERLTPGRFVETPDQQPNDGWYDCPLPLNERYFLVSYSFSPDETETTGYGLYLLDAYGGKELLYRDDELSALFPMPLGPRRRPPVLPELGEPAPEREGEFLVQDVHEGLDPSARGKARYLQIVECHERHLHTRPYAIEVGPDSGFETKTVLGTVPVERDGSAYFRLPVGKSVFFSVLDERHQALHTMRSVTNVQPGERTGCVGCHESARRAPSGTVTLATKRNPSPIEPPPWGVQPMDYSALIQPVLDKHCVRCHDGTAGSDKTFDLTACQRRPFMGVDLPASYYNLRQYVRHAPIHQYYLPPGSFGSGVSPVMAVLAKGHYQVALAEAEWRLLCAWIDCNAPGLGDYEAAEVATAEARERARSAARRQELAGRRNASPERRNQLAEALPKGERLVCYLDCGPEVADGRDGGPVVRELAGTPYVYGAGEAVVPPWYDDIAFGDQEVLYEVTGLDPASTYKLGFSWWDHNNAGREQSVVVAAEGQRPEQVLPKTKLPAWKDRQEKPADLVVPLPQRLSAAGALRISFRNDSAAGNAVVSEVWLLEESRPE